MKNVSDFLRLAKSDYIKGLIVAVATAVLATAYEILQSGISLSKAQLILIGKTAIAAAIAYLIKNGLTNSKDQFLTKEPKKD